MELSGQVLIRSSCSNDLPAVKKLLKDLHLPIEGVQDQFKNYIILENQSKELIGVAGLEIYNQFGLLRSVAVHQKFQNKNFGTDMVKKVEEFGKSKNLKEIYLLTETAEKFFSKHGYTIVQRDLVPKVIQASYEYSTACKVSAIVMKKCIN